MKLRSTAILRYATVLLLVAQTGSAQILTGQSFQKNPDQDDTRTYLQYLVNLPAEYYSDSNREWPLIVFLHYRGAEGTDIDLLRRAALPGRLNEGADLPFVVVSPQALLKQLWKPILIKNFIKQICETYRVDRERIYITGPSAGGSATWATAVEYPNLPAAIAPVCGRSNPTTYDQDAARIAHIPV